MPRRHSTSATVVSSQPRASGSSMTGVPYVLAVHIPRASTWDSTRMDSRDSRARSTSPRLAFTSNPASTVASDATGDGPEYRYGGAATFMRSFTAVGSATNASSDEYALENPPTSTTLS